MTRVLNLENATKRGKYKNIRPQEDIQTRQRILEKAHAHLMTLLIESLSMTFTADGKRQRLPLIFCPVILK